MTTSRSRTSKHLARMWRALAIAASSNGTSKGTISSPAKPRAVADRPPDSTPENETCSRTDGTRWPLPPHSLQNFFSWRRPRTSMVRPLPRQLRHACALPASTAPASCSAASAMAAVTAASLAAALAAAAALSAAPPLDRLQICWLLLHVLGRYAVFVPETPAAAAAVAPKMGVHRAVALDARIAARVPEAAPALVLCGAADLPHGLAGTSGAGL
eukprot:CAMPEP_0168362260 /NCGR_PEP_ID=MMETSP0228-20121227/3087_1 /TAXON_ID=133427 /ORGANISM="Protoceratium reticulatum, Strain CCCM 535 (=CCMP 1889)" /LENGTH=214 /DNA_ID=CAMNT_0008374957 /DNA_START=187 /DNA_END=830 /DNA_ORIENTATION=-